MADTETVHRERDLVPMTVKVSKLEKGLLQADRETADSEFLSGHVRGILRDYLRRRFGGEALSAVGVPGENANGD